MADGTAFDPMCRLCYATPEPPKPLFDVVEYQLLVRTTVAGVKARQGIPNGEEGRVFRVLGTDSVAETVRELDDIGVSRG